MTDAGIMIDTPEQIEMFHLLAMKGALKLEVLGLKHSRGSVYALVKKRFGFKGNKQEVLKQLETLVEAKKLEALTNSKKDGE